MHEKHKKINYNIIVEERPEKWALYFCMERFMEKTEKNKAKDRARIGNRIWERVPVTLDKRKTASGVTFWGRYVEKT